MSQLKTNLKTITSKQKDLTSNINVLFEDSQNKILN